jgi:hypothetical protein
MVQESRNHRQNGRFLAAVLGGGTGKHRAHLFDERAALPERADLRICDVTTPTGCLTRK